MTREKKIIKTSFIGIILNIVLVILKAIIGVLANSIAIIMDAINNLSDALSSALTILGTKLAGKRANKKHPFGYGQFEYITSITIAIIILIAGIISIKESFDKILDGGSSTYHWYSFVILIIAILIKLFLGFYFKKRGNEYNSKALKASGTDSLFDSIITFSTLIAALISVLFSINIEGYLGIVISAFILKAGIEILMDSLSNIVGLRIDPEISNKVKEAVSSFDEVYGAYDLILHNYGPEKTIGSVHIEVNDNLTAKEIHKLTQRIRYKIYTEFGIIITVGIYASNDTEFEFSNMKKYVKGLVSQYPQILQMHGFYVDTNFSIVTFDIVIDFSEEKPIDLKNELIKKLSDKYSKYKFIINLDTDFSD